MTNTRSGVTGFTLVEVLIALVVGGMALAGAAALLHALGGRADSLGSAVRRLERDANAERLLRALLGVLDVTSASAPAVTGDTRSVGLRAWCPVPAGWLDRCQARLYFAQRDGGVALQLDLADAGESPMSLTVGHGTMGRFRYLIDPAHGGSWADAWSQVAPPAAVAVIMDSDTLFLAVWHGG